MTRSIKLLPRAARELAALPAAVQDQVIAKLELLYDYPKLGPEMFDAFAGYRALLAARDKYRIVYRITTNGDIEIAYIRHCAQQIGLRPVRSDEESA